MWRRVIVWFVKKYPSGMAQMTAVTRSGWMIATRPRSRAAACRSDTDHLSAETDEPDLVGQKLGEGFRAPPEASEPIVARCQSVAASANEEDARIASRAAT